MAHVCLSFAEYALSISVLVAWVISRTQSYLLTVLLSLATGDPAVSIPFADKKSRSYCFDVASCRSEFDGYSTDELVKVRPELLCL